MEAAQLIEFLRLLAEKITDAPVSRETIEDPIFLSMLPDVVDALRDEVAALRVLSARLRTLPSPPG